MSEIKFKLKGHESFVLREGWLTKGLSAIRQNSMVYRINRGADVLGVGTNMAKSIRYWLRAFGLTVENQKTGIALTELGEAICSFDIYGEDIFTLWILHANITCNFEFATSWALFFNRMNLASEFSRDEMYTLMRELVVQYTKEEDPSERSIRDDCAAILSMYVKTGDPADDPEDKRSSPFEDLGLVVQSGKKYRKGRPSTLSLAPLAFLYLIIDKLNQEKSLQIDSIAEDDNMPGKVFNLTRIVINDYLDRLKKAGYIKVDRTAGLDIVYPDSCKEMTRIDVVKTHYDGRSQI